MSDRKIIPFRRCVAESKIQKYLGYLNILVLLKLIDNSKRKIGIIKRVTIQMLWFELKLTGQRWSLVWIFFKAKKGKIFSIKHWWLTCQEAIFITFNDVVTTTSRVKVQIVFFFLFWRKLLLNVSLTEFHWFAISD